jgi:hypothetical protein
MKCDLHVHSFYSLKDGVNSPEDIIRYTMKIGLDGVAITDHDTLNGWIHGRAYAEKKEFTLIPGMEISSRDGHILGLYITEEVPKGHSAQETLELIHAQGGVAVAAHLCDMLRKGVGDLVKTLDFDGIEVLNGRNYFVNGRAKKVAETLDMAVTGGSDGHIIDEIGSCYTIYDGDLYEAIEKKTTRAEGGLTNPLSILKAKLKTLRGSPYTPPETSFLFL